MFGHKCQHQLNMQIIPIFHSFLFSLLKIECKPPAIHYSTSLSSIFRKASSLISNKKEVFICGWVNPLSLHVQTAEWIPLNFALITTCSKLGKVLCPFQQHNIQNLVISNSLQLNTNQRSDWIVSYEVMKNHAITSF